MTLCHLQVHSSVGVKDLLPLVEELNNFFTCRLSLFEHNMRKCYRETIMWWPNWIDHDGKYSIHLKKRVRDFFVFRSEEK